MSLQLVTTNAPDDARLEPKRRRTFRPLPLLLPLALLVPMLVGLWQVSPLLAAAVALPAAALALYQRSLHRALGSMRLTLTDGLTGLGNHRHFHERLQADLDRAQAERIPVTLVLLDVDDFKRLNEARGPALADGVLEQVAAHLRRGGEAFRVGADDFALLLPAKDESEGQAIAEAILRRLGEAQWAHGVAPTFSAGVATFPTHTRERSELLRLADAALAWARSEGGDRISVYRPDLPELGALRRLASGADRTARLSAAASLAHAVDARDAYTGSHSHRVGQLAERIATRMGLSSDDIDLVRLAGSLHDLGKLAIPEEILRKPGPLTDEERAVLEEHPEIGFRMLQSLCIEPIATWLRHHHERWDGTGYPHRLKGPDIPLGARILFVADAFDAMTTDRIYRPALSQEVALEELRRCAGSQFDPRVVAALVNELGAGDRIAQSA